MSGVRTRHRFVSHATLAALAVPATVWAIGLGAYALAESMIEDRAIALIFAAVMLVSLAPLASGGGGRRGQA